MIALKHSRFVDMCIAPLLFVLGACMPSIGALVHFGHSPGEKTLSQSPARLPGGKPEKTWHSRMNGLIEGSRVRR